MWKNIYKNNDWGRVAYHRGRNGAAIEAGMHRVKWPDGKDEVVKVVTKGHTEMVSDHSPLYPVHSKIPHIKTNVHGKELLIDLAESGCKIWIDK